MNTQNSFLKKFFSTKKLLKIVVLAVLGLGIILSAAGGASLYFFSHEVMETPGKLAVVEIDDGDSLSKVAGRLESAKIIKSSFKFKILARLKGESSRLQAGVFEFSTGWTPLQVLDHLVHGKPTLERITIREGLPLWSVGKILEDAGFVKKEEFDKAVADKDLLNELGVPFKNAEGFLYPDTYFLKKPATPEEGDAKKLVSLMVNTFWKKSANVWGDKKPDGNELKRLIILASLVEKETGVASERAKVAGVYSNRLRIGMALQCDPTVIYGMGEGFDANLKRRHLNDDENEYNTYKHPGLPPGPICSPGLAALEAAVSPAKHDYLYFVATGLGDGKHNFNKTLQAHNKDVANYLAERRKHRRAQTNSAGGEAGTVVEEEALPSNSTAILLAGSTNASQKSNSTSLNASMGDGVDGRDVPDVPDVVGVVGVRGGGDVRGGEPESRNLPNLHNSPGLHDSRNSRNSHTPEGGSHAPLAPVGSEVASVRVSNSTLNATVKTIAANATLPSGNGTKIVPSPAPVQTRQARATPAIPTVTPIVTPPVTPGGTQAAKLANGTIASANAGPLNSVANLVTSPAATSGSAGNSTKATKAGNSTNTAPHASFKNATTNLPTNLPANLSAASAQNASSAVQNATGSSSKKEAKQGFKKKVKKKKRKQSQ